MFDTINQKYEYQKLKITDYIKNIFLAIVFLPVIPNPTSTQSRAIFVARMVFFLFFFIQYRKNYHEVHQRYILVPAFVYSLILVFSSASTTDFCSTSTFHAFIDGISMIGIILWIEYKKQKYGELVYKLFLGVTGFFVVSNLITFFLYPEGMRVNEYGQYVRVYLLGGKFSIAYFHLIFIALFFYVFQNANKFIVNSFALLFAAYAIWLEKDMNGATGLVIFLFAFTYIFFKLPVKFISHPSFVLGSMFVLSMVLLFSFDLLRNNETYLYVTENILGKDSGMTGRSTIYQNFAVYLNKESVLFGVGNTTDMIHKITDCGNLQNEYFMKLYQSGLFGLISFIVYLFYSIKSTIKNDSTICWLASLMGFLIASLVEISFDMYFVFFMSLMPKSDIEFFCLNSGKK